MVSNLGIEKGADDEVHRLRKIVAALMNQVERTMDVQGGGFSLFQTAILLDDKVRDRTRALETTLKQLELANGELKKVNAEALITRSRLEQAAQLSEAKVTLEQRVRERTAALSSLNEKLRQEIAERREVEEKLRLAKAAAEDANLSKTRFLAAASHDLLQPLNAARLFISTLQGVSLVKQTAYLVERTDVALQGVESLLSSLLEISSLDAGAIPTKKNDFRIMDVLQRLANEYRPIVNEAGLELRLVNCSLTVTSDRKLLERILRNFLSNAVRYTQRGKILLGCRRQGNKLIIQVTDTGPGICEKDLEVIFNEFHQLKQSGVKYTSGVGLGLAIVRRIAEMLEVVVRVSSRIDHGSTFMIEVPISKRQAQQSLPPSDWNDSSLKMPLIGTSVLVVDNEDSIQEGMSQLLLSWGCRVQTAGNMDGVCQLVGRDGFKPDFLIVDYHLDNHLTGIDILSHIDEKFGLSVPSIVVTADRSDEMRNRVFEAGYRMLNKPLKPHRLRAWMTHSMKANKCGAK